jgi:CRP-like cAMP-binding protein
VSDLFERLLLLKQSPIFSLVSTDDLRIVAGVLEQEQFFTGDRIFEINDQGDHLYLLVSGKVGISIDPDPGSRNFIATLGPGDCFGEMNLLDDLPRSATAHVLEDATVLTLEKSRLRGLILSYPEISIGMLRALSMRLREANLRTAGRPVTEH